ncbi:phosphatase PAP2 family protein [Neobacillus mesonae]|uniref:phosphatase PAP2 family protein n=1 Tax=Neobacillus mesonae TaxID=1193713 RepID=UPI00204109DE|nr:phosphatase PAP2 family protein [Neobacillus mesonae]MCM3567772.1 phosphatase PAP2 family protein [Neobacillus mesonae]
MKVYLKRAPYLLFLLIIPVLGLIYQLLNERSHKAVDFISPIDQSIPFVPIFIIPYILWYAYIFCYLVYFCFKDPKVYLKTLTLIAAGEMMCFVIYFFFQTTVPRPAVMGDDIISMMVQFVYTHDQPYNCFPSIHVLTTFAIMLASIHIKNKHMINTIMLHIGGTLIIISTLFVKQHVIFDMIGSMFLVAFLYGLSFELFSIRVPKKSETVYVKNKG